VPVEPFVVDAALSDGEGIPPLDNRFEESA